MNDKINADRFLGFAELYENVRPSVPEQACTFLTNYIGKTPETVVDLGCGTGLSTAVWQDKCKQVIGIEPSEDMLNIAKSKARDNVSFLQAFSDNTGLPNELADIVVCSQSFHWMEPQATLAEVNRILKNGGVFATVDCDLPPVCSWQAEQSYQKLRRKVEKIELSRPNIRKTFQRFDKANHLKNISQSGYFRYSREIVFANREMCNAERFIGIAMSQGGLQTILKTQPELLEQDIADFEACIKKLYDDSDFEITFCYRMRIGVK